MTALQLNAEIYQSLGVLSQDENMLRRAANYLKRLASELTQDSTLMTKDEFFSRVEEAEREIEQGKGIRMLPDESLDEFLRRIACNRWRRLYSKR